MDQRLLPQARVWQLPAYIYAFVSAAIIVALCIFFEPSWESNDDIAMSMVAHGYGIAAYSSPNLVFSNVLWGYLVSSLPPINGVVGYSWLTLTMLFIVTWSMLYFLNRLETGHFLALGVVLLIMLRAVCFPQFTIVAGLLTVSAVMGWVTYVKTSSRSMLLAALLLGFCGFLIRGEVFWFVLIVALPLMPWRTLLKDRLFLIGVATMALGMLTAVVVDRQSYTSPSWQAFREFNPIRGQFTDYGAGFRMRNHDDIRERFGYTKNDLDLLVNWFYVDSTITDTGKLSEMLHEAKLLNLSDTFVENYNTNHGWKSLPSLADISLLPLEIVFVGLVVFSRKRHALVVATVIFIGLIFVLGLLGRPGVLRAYYPAVALLTVSPLLLGGAGRSATLAKVTVTLALIFSCIAVVVNITPESRKKSAGYKRMQADVVKLQANMSKIPYFVTWAQYFPFEYAYPVLSPPSKLRFYALNAFTNAPFSVSFNESKKGRGLMNQILSGQPIPMVASEYNYVILGAWCRERFQRNLQRRAVTGLGTFDMFFITCAQ